MSDRIELLESVLCGLAFDLGRTPYCQVIEDGYDVEGMLNINLLLWADTISKQARALDYLAGTMAGLAKAMVDLGLVHPSTVQEAK